MPSTLDAALVGALEGVGRKELRSKASSLDHSAKSPADCCEECTRLASGTVSWPQNEALAREADAVLAEIELRTRIEFASGAETPSIPYNLLARLVAIALPQVPNEVGEFITAVQGLIEQLPRGPAHSFLVGVTNPTPNAGNVGSNIGRLFWNTQWQAGGCPAVSIDPRIVASLMVSEVAPDLVDDVRPPWDCFLIRLPSALISWNGVDYTHVVAHQYTMRALPSEWLDKIEDLEVRRIAERVHAFSERRAGEHWYIGGLAGEHGQLNVAGPLAEALGHREREHLIEPEIADDDPESRVLECLSRLVVGVCNLVTDSPASLRRKSTKKQGARFHRDGRAPQTTEYVLAPDVRVTFDCTEAVRLYVSGERRSLPKLQWIVRGHWRNQAAGPGLSERRRIWIQPYWKGPADAARRLREHEVHEAAPPDEEDS